MIFKVKYSQRAADDLDEIIRYINDELCNPQAAERFYNAANKKLGLMQENPYMFPLYHDKRLKDKVVRFAVIGNYLMFYMVDNDSSIINIARILYGSRDIPLVENLL